MLHTAAESSWSNPPGDLTRLAMAPAPVDVSMAAPVALQEASLKTPAAWTQQPAAAAQAAPAASSGTLDTAMMALALISAWMVLAGAALLVRHVRITRIEATQL